MATLPAGTSLSTVARILHAAATLGPGAWEPGRPKDADSSAPASPALSSDLLALFAMLRDRSIQYVLVGGVALLRYIEGRNTDTIDLVLSVGSLTHLPELVVKDRNADFARATFQSIRVDLLLTSNAVFKHVAENRATVHRFSELDVRCATVEGLVLLKLYALPSLYRQANLQRAALYEADLTMLCQRYRPALPPLLAFLEPHLEAGSVQELRSIIAEIEQRVARMDRAKGR